MEISCLMVHAEKIEEEKLKKMSREKRRQEMGDGNFSHPRSDNFSHPRSDGRSNFNKGFPVKYPQTLHIISTKIGSLTIHLKEEMIVDFRCLLMLVVEENMKEST